VSAYPSSFQQRDVWLNQQIAPSSSAYNVAFRYEVDVALDGERLRAALAAVAQRHAALRAAFDFDGFNVIQHVAERVEPVVEELVGDAAELAFVARPFTLTGPPLFRCGVRRAGDRTHLTLVYHHLLADGWSATLLERDLSAAYDDPAALPPGEDRSYFEYCERQRAACDDESAVAAERAYWTELLGDLEPSRFDGVPKSAGPRPADELVIALAPHAVRHARERATSRHVTPFTVVLDAFARAAADLAAASSVVVGVTVAGRSDPAYFETVGQFAHVVPLVYDGGRDGLQALQRQVWRSQARSVLPWDVVFAGDARRARVASRWPLSITSLQQSPAPPFGAPARRLRSPRLDSKAPFLLRVDFEGESITPIVVYQRDVFTRAALDAFVRSFVAAFDVAVTA
jgi:Condensation domain